VNQAGFLKLKDLINLKNLILLLFSIFVLIVFPLKANTYYLTLIITGFLWSYVSICWNLVGGYGSLFSFGHASFFAVGAYTSTILYIKFGVTPWFGMVLGSFLSGLLALLMSIVTLRYKIKGIYFSLATLAFAEVIRNLLDNWKFVGSSEGLLLTLINSPKNFLFTNRVYYYYIGLAFILFGLAVTYIIQKNKIGYYIIAIREDDLAAEVSGVPTSNYKALITIISAMMTALGGTFYAQFLLYISPEITAGWEPQLQMIIGTMVGGPGTIYGPVIGSMLFTVLREVLEALPLGNLKDMAVIFQRIVWGVVLVVVLLYMPGGLVKFFEVFRKKSKPVKLVITIL
jgi:branched-chain amino acid transport system permease protein